MLRGQTVVVRGSKIESVGAGPLAIAEDLEPITGAGRTLLPGFIDAHVHIGLLDPKKVLAGGITAARDLGWPKDRIFPLLRELEKRPVDGPFLIAAGPMITARGGYPTGSGWAPRGTGLELEDAAEAREAVRALCAEAHTIKVAQEPRGGPTLPLAVLSVVVDEAHALGRPVSSHIGSLEQLELALEAGVDELAHGLWSDEEIPGDVIVRMVEAGMVVVPTLHIDPSGARLENLRRFLAAGGRVIYGTDMGNTGPPAGIDAEELKLMVRAGMSPTRALASATSAAADHLGLEGRGRIVPGALADLVLVECEPTEDFAVLSRPAAVFRQGKLIGEPGRIH